MGIRKKPIGIPTTVFLAQYIDYYNIINLNRVDYLVSIAKEVYHRKINGSRKNSKELIRSAVVLLHASLEDTLRSICTLYIDDSFKDVIDTIPMVNISSSGRAEKFSLGSLLPHKNKTISELISESVREYYNNYVNFSTTNEIAFHLKRVNVDLSRIKVYFQDLDILITKRHLIAHHVDLIHSGSYKKPAPISMSEVKRWILMVDRFTLEILGHLTDNKYSRKNNSSLASNKISPNYRVK